MKPKWKIGERSVKCWRQIDLEVGEESASNNDGSDTGLDEQSNRNVKPIKSVNLNHWASFH